MKIISNIQIPSKFERTVALDVYFMNDNIPKSTIIFIHGYKSFKDWGAFDLMGRYFARKGFLFIKFNMSYNGISPDNLTQITEPEVFGKNTIEIELADIESVCAWLDYNSLLEGIFVNKDNISLIGHSRGGSEAILYAAANPQVKKVISWAAFKSFEEVWQMYYDMEEWKQKGVIFRQDKLSDKKLPLYYSLYQNYLENKELFNIKNAVKKLGNKLMLVHGIDDFEIPYTHAVEMKKWNKKIELNLIPGASHLFGNFHPYNLPFLPNDTQIIIEDSISFIKS